ncbi:hypothetical protein SAMN05444380_10261 [Thermophagus xiamenensis]|uniref:Uncharacterized protein n=1 Tax=Thermophagus xiamenensis TaxID=385682 RepID=A0A1I1V7L2_9BACT|nr:hypothetical protein SAMN05444380_10261 [Thermophagus xiamenensis]
MYECNGITIIEHWNYAFCPFVLKKKFKDKTDMNKNIYKCCHGNPP